MRRWRRRTALLLGLLALVLLVRGAASLNPPSLRVAPERSTVLGVTVINPGRDRRPDQTITMRGGVIESIRDSVQPAQRRPRDQVYQHGYALPGLIDLDVRRLPRRDHLQRLFGVWFLAGGITTVQLTGGAAAALPHLTEQIAAEAIPWPRLITCGGLLVGEGVACDGAHTVASAADALVAVDALVAAGAPCGAVHRSVPAPALAALRDAASAKGLRLVGDGDFPGARLFSRATAVSPAESAADWLRGWAAAPNEVTASFVTGVQRWNWLALPQPPALVPQADLLPRFYREEVWPRQRAAALANGDVDAAAVQAAVNNMLGAVRAADAAGTPLSLGSATPSAYVAPGMSLWLEMMTLAAAGVPLEDLWVAATRGAGEILGIPKLGVLEDGAPADLLIYRDDPTRDPAALMTLQAVVSRGRLYPARILNGYQLEYARYAQGWLYDRLTMLGARLGLLDETDDACSPL